jgi:hypothetical protein
VGRHRLLADGHGQHTDLGELSDLYGRKLMLQTSVVIFVVVSALAGLSH